MSEITFIDVGRGQQIGAIYKGSSNRYIEGEQERPLIIMAHDFPGHKSGNNDLFADLEYRLTNRGHHTVRFDFRGCGDSDGAQEEFTLGSACEDFQVIRHWAIKRGYRSFAYIGEGIGSTIAMMNIADDVNVFLSLWPVLDLKGYAENVFDLKALEGEALKNGYAEFDGARVGTHFINELSNTDLDYVFKEMKMPTMIFHGVQDQKIPIEQLDLVRENVKARRIEITSFQDGAEGLQKLNHRRAIFYQTQQFVEKYA